MQTGYAGPCAMGPNLLLPPVVVPTHCLNSTSLVTFHTHSSKPVFSMGAGRPPPSVLDREVPCSSGSHHGALSWSVSLRLPSCFHVALLNSIVPVLLYAHHRYQMNETRSLATDLTVYWGRRAVRRSSYVPDAVPGTPVILTLAIEGRELLTTPVLQVTD